MNVSLPDATAYNSKQLAIQKDMTPSLYAMFFKVTYNYNITPQKILFSLINPFKIWKFIQKYIALL